VQEQLIKLVQLQKISLRISYLESETDRIPGLIRLAGEKIKGSEEKVLNLRNRLEESQKENRRLAGLLDGVQQSIADYKSKLNNSKEIRTNEQYRAMLKQIDGAENESYQLLEQQLECEDQAKQVKIELKEQEKELARIRTECSQDQAKLEADRERMDAEKQDLLEQLSGVEAGLDAQVLANFRRVAAARGGVGLAELREDACKACHVRLRPQVVCEVKLNNQLMHCDNCKRIMFWPAGMPHGKPREKAC